MAKRRVRFGITPSIWHLIGLGTAIARLIFDRDLPALQAVHDHVARFFVDRIVRLLTS